MFYSLDVLSAMILTERNTNLNLDNLTINKMLSKYVQYLQTLLRNIQGHSNWQPLQAKKRFEWKLHIHTYIITKPRLN